MFRVGLSVLLACVCVQAAFGQYPERHYRDWEVSGFGGGSFVVGDFNFNTPVFADGQKAFRPVGINYASGYQLGIRVGENLGPLWGADLEYSFANQPLTLTNITPTIQSLPLGQSINHFSYSISYTPLPRTSRFRPYGKVGTGASLFFIHGDSKEAALEQGVKVNDTWKFLINLGGGLKYLAGDQVALMFDVKDHLTSVPSYGLPGSARVVNGVFQPGMAVKGWMNNWQLNFGVAFQWDD